MDAPQIDLQSVLAATEDLEFYCNAVVTIETERPPLVNYPGLEKCLAELIKHEREFWQASQALSMHEWVAVREMFPDGSVVDWEAVSARVPAHIKDASRRALCLCDADKSFLGHEVGLMVCAAIVEALGLAGVHDRPQALGIARAVIFGGPAVPLNIDMSAEGQDAEDAPTAHKCPHCGSPTDADTLRCGICRRYLA